MGIGWIIGISVFSVLAILTGVFIYIKNKKEPEIMMLDGPGSYVDSVRGTVIKVNNDNGMYELILMANAEDAERFGISEFSAKVRDTSKEFATGDNLMVTFAGGYSNDRFPEIVANPYEIYKIDE